MNGGTMNGEDPTSPIAFERRYQGCEDPWGFATDAYEQHRYAQLLAAIGPGPFAAAFEPGCSIGVFTALLGPRCVELLATDPSPTAVAAAARRCAGLDHVRVEPGALPTDLPAGPCDLIVFSELGYYFDEARLADVVTAVVDRLGPQGRIAGTHWIGRSADHRIHGEQVHAVLDTHRGLTIEHRERHERRAQGDGYLLGVWRRR